MVGFPELSPFGGGWCGNEVFGAWASELLTPEIWRQARQAVIAMGEELRREGCWGCFGLDLLLDQDTGTLYLGEMNPWITGASPMTNQAAVDARRPPLLLFHLLEWMGIDFSFDGDEFNEHWLQASAVAPWSQLIIEHTREASETMTGAPPSGLWRMLPDGQLAFVRPAFHPGSPAGDDEVLLMRTMDRGYDVGRGSSIGRLAARGRLMDDNHRLTDRAQAWIQGFRGMFTCEVL